MKKVKFITVFILIFALFAIFGGAYAFYRYSYAFKKTNGGKLVMAYDNTDELRQYEEMKDELDEKYLVEFCRIFEEAKGQLISKTEQSLGEEYAQKKREIEDEKKNIAELAKTLSDSPELNELKDKLAQLKSELIVAITDEQRTQVKDAMKEVLKEVTDINLANFKTLAEKKKGLDELTEQLKAIIASGKADIKSIENEVLTSARQKIKRMIFAYGAEAETLAKTFDVKEFSREPYFLTILNPDMKVVDFDKEKVIAAVHESRDHRRLHDHYHHGKDDKKALPDCHDSHGCDGNCSGCENSQDESTSVYTSKSVDKNDN